MTTYIVMFCEDAEGDEPRSVEEFAQEVQGAYDEGHFSGNFIVIERNDNDVEFWRRWEQGAKERMKNAAQDRR